MGNCMEKRLALDGALSVAVDIVLLWLWKLCRPDEPPDGRGLPGDAACSAGATFADSAAEPKRTSCTSVGSIRRLLREDMIRH